jgi:hypothetical protein
MAIEHMSESAKHVGDAVSIVTVVGTLAQILPSIAAIFTIVWTSIRIYETETIQKLLGKKKVEDVTKD